MQEFQFDQKNKINKHVKKEMKKKSIYTVFENCLKSRIQHCVCILNGQKWTKVNQMRQNLGEYWKLEACGQTVLPDKSL